MALSDTARAALRSHLETIARSTTLARRAETLTRSAAGLLALSVVIAAVVVILISLTTARRLSAYTSAPIEELVQWVGRIEQRKSLPSPSDRGGAPEFDALRRALRTMADALEEGRRQEVERERLAAFRETARHVAHEMRGPLTAALRKGNVEIARILMEAGARADRLVSNRTSMLHLAAATGDADLVTEMLDLGAEVNRKDGDGDTPLHWASHLGHADVARVLIERGARVNTQNYAAFTPLTLAKRRGNDEVVTVLVSQGAGSAPN